MKKHSISIEYIDRSHRALSILWRESDVKPKKNLIFKNKYSKG